MRKILIGIGGILGFLVIRRFSNSHSENLSSGGRVFDTPFGTKRWGTRRWYGFTMDINWFKPFMEFVRIPGRDWEMGRYEVTQKQWKEVMGTEPWKGKKYVREGDFC